MKTRIEYRKRLAPLAALLFCFLSLASLLMGCDSDKVGGNFYTFTGETVGSYLKKDSADFSEFWKAVQMADLQDLLQTYNKYTCFAPTNAAMKAYYASQGVSSLGEMAVPDVKYMVYSHLVTNKVYASTDFTQGALSATNMNSRYLVIGFKASSSKVDITVNSNSTIVTRDIEVENGIIHSLDRVLTPSTYALPVLMANDPRISLFVQAMQTTHLDDSLQLIRDDSYVPETNPLSIDSKTICRSPQERKIGYTAFVETNEVLYNALEQKGYAKDLDGLRQYAKSIYDAMYPDDANITDEADRRNSLNRFVAYHLIDKTINYNNFFYKANMSTGVTLYEFMETFCPNTIFKVSNDGGAVVINSDQPRNVAGVRVLPIESGYTQDTENGVYHLIDKVLTYNKETTTMLANTRIRVDAASLHPELMTNGIRYEKGDNPAGVTGADKYYKFPAGYLKNAQILSSNTGLYYLQGNTSSGSWINYQADEMMALGQFDFIMKLPPVPAGTYEVRFGYTANPSRGILQFYVDGEAQGIPLNMKLKATDPSVGWISDASTTDDGIEVDKMLRNRGYMKGGTSYLAGTSPARSDGGAMRRIICTKTWDADGAHYIRFKSVSADGNDQFMIDYFELVPKNVYANPNGTAEDRL
jgi:uncharacterized surface protein with fasciclin (FAS1) repeats